MPFHPSSRADQHELPCPEALLAATLTFMTAHAQACCEHHRQLITDRVAGNLAMLSEHPLLSPHFRAGLWDLASQWRQVRGVVQPHPTSQLHAAPGTVQ